ncbi:MAG TPA: 30S ribosomal protein S5 [Candidatus Acidoferrales bacterium]|uniref:Small ribosomal subunit protein uS5 n=1 Tax=uncultured Acidobacteria bacterium Rifle_16ft_4_minimus_23617 TaxID=1665082 RepID=A0A0H4T4K7_9BACT|nr:30S ribosomal protein S5, small subunit ribosomal protein S5 [uncultured Acidobacteria bacterium Rifle_16ft_4_minimus_23617]HKZ52339.1 30S ribosomal protein S5 [Candidatus Acidoferrales bacterium]
MSKTSLAERVRWQKPIDASSLLLKEHVVAINRVTKVVKGGKNLSFSALVVVGDGQGTLGYGLGKAREVPMAIRKGIELAKKRLLKVNLTPPTIPHQVVGRYEASRVLLKPAPEGAGVIAGGPVRPVLEAAGIQNVFTKAIGNTNPHNVVKATLDALLQLKDKQMVATLRGKEPQEL